MLNGLVLNSRCYYKPYSPQSHTDRFILVLFSMPRKQMSDFLLVDDSLYLLTTAMLSNHINI